MMSTLLLMNVLYIAETIDTHPIHTQQLFQKLSEVCVDIETIKEQLKHLP